MISRVLMPNLPGYDFILGSARVARLVKVEHSCNDFSRNRNRVCGPLNATPHRCGSEMRLSRPLFAQDLCFSPRFRRLLESRGDVSG
jgi:hypothetical protein